MSDIRGLFLGIRTLTLLGLVIFFTACTDAPLPSRPCDEQFGNYLSIAPNGDLAASYCKKGKRGIILRTKNGEEWLEPPSALYSTPAFSPDGSTLLFAQVDFTNRTSALLAYELATKTTQTIVESSEAISFSAMTPDKKTVYFWAGTFRQSGMTGAADFRLHRRSLTDGRDEVLDGPYFVAYNVSVDDKGGAYYGYDGNNAKGNLVNRARMIGKNDLTPTNLEFPDLGGAVFYTLRGLYREVRGYKPGTSYYKYCVIGPGLDGQLCNTKSLSISFDGKTLTYFDSQHQLHVESISEGDHPLSNQ